VIRKVLLSSSIYNLNHSDKMYAIHTLFLNFKSLFTRDKQIIVNSFCHQISTTDNDHTITHNAAIHTTHYSMSVISGHELQYGKRSERWKTGGGVFFTPRWHRPTDSCIAHTWCSRPLSPNFHHL